MTIGQAIRFIRVQRGYKQSILAEKAKLDVSYISLLENNKRDPSFSSLCTIVESLGVPFIYVTYLLLTQEELDKVTNAAGFSYKWDEKSEQFAHAGGIMIATPEGKMSRYLFGIDYSPKDVKFGVMESSNNKVGSAAEQLLLYCYHYDPSTGKYGLAVLRIMRIGGIATLAAMGLMGFVFWRRNKKKVSSEA